MQRPLELRRSTFDLPKMDCPSEERLIRLSLAGASSVRELSFELEGHRLAAVHTGPAEEILDVLAPLNMGATLATSEVLDHAAAVHERHDDAAERRVLVWLLAINAAMFLVEIVVGWIAQSTGLIADSLDMFADAAVYGVALVAVGRAAATKVRAARLAGFLQLALALALLVEVGRRFAQGSEPQSALMIGISLVALVANAACLVMVAKQRDRGAHMKASYIFSANDVIANAGVIVAGALVWWTGSRLPDLVIGAAIGAVVLAGARRILALR
jgi:Co/Zn/Cd efflux system component